MILLLSRKPEDHLALGPTMVDCWSRLEICTEEVWDDLRGFRLGSSECLDASVWLVMDGRECGMFGD